MATCQAPKNPRRFPTCPRQHFQVCGRTRCLVPQGTTHRNPAKPNEAPRSPTKPHEAQRSPTKPREAQLSPAKPHEAPTKQQPRRITSIQRLRRRDVASPKRPTTPKSHPEEHCGNRNFPSARSSATESISYCPRLTSPMQPQLRGPTTSGAIQSRISSVFGSTLPGVGCL